MASHAGAGAGTPAHHRGLVPVRSVVLVYVVAGLLWIFGSGPVADRLTEITTISRWGMEFGKGVLFVAVTALLLQVVLRRRADRLDAVAASVHANARRLASSEDRNRLLATALAGTASAVVITRRDGTIEWVNAAFESMSGYPASVADGTTPRLVNSGVQDERFYRDLWRTVLGGQVWRGQLVNRRSDGELYTVSATITPILAEDGEVQHLVAIQEDITERRRTEQQLLRSQRLDGLGTLAGGIAHDLNNVLAPIMLATQSLQRPDADAATSEMLDIIEQSASRGADMVAQVLSFARGVDGQPRDIDVDRLLDDVTQIVGTTFPKSIEVRRHDGPEAWPVHGDPTQLHQVLMNLCINARDAMPDGGALHLRVDNLVLGEDDMARDHRAASVPTSASASRTTAPASTRRAQAPRPCPAVGLRADAVDWVPARPCSRARPGQRRTTQR